MNKKFTIGNALIAIALLTAAFLLVSKPVYADTGTFFPAQNSDSVNYYTENNLLRDDDLVVGNPADETRVDSAVRFPLVGIPNGATIISATLTVTCETGRSDMISTVLQYDDVDDSVTFVPGTPSSFTGRTWSVSNVVWDPAGCGAGVGTELVSPDISSLIQEIVDRAGWVEGNALTIGWFEDGSTDGTFLQLDSYEVNPVSTYLSIEWEGGGPPPTPEIGGATSTIDQTQQNLSTAFYLFFIVFFGVVWLLRKH